MLTPTHRILSVRRQCQLLQVNRSSLYYQRQQETVDNVYLMNEIRDIWLKHSFLGYRKITVELRKKGLYVNRKRIQRLMRKMGIQSIPKAPYTSSPNKAHDIYPYLLADCKVERPNQAWMVDITYLRLDKGFAYLVALIDVHSRYVVSWSLSNSLDTSFCIDAFNNALIIATPTIINSDQGSQFTSEDWINALEKNKIQISMTGKGRCIDNVYIERFWRSLKYELIYLNDYGTIPLLRRAIAEYVKYYNYERSHQSLNYDVPAVWYNSSITEQHNNQLLDLCTQAQTAGMILNEVRL